MTAPSMAPKAPRPDQPHVPVLARIAGLPTETMSAYGSHRCAEASEHYTRIHDSLTAARTQLVDRLYVAIEGAPLVQRRFLLDVKRACFNGQSLEPYRNAARWQALVEVGGSLIDDILVLESELSAVVERFERDHLETCAVQRGELVRHVADPSFRRGLALASPTLSKNARRLGDGADSYSERRRRRLESSLLCYVSRAALKLSPFSTFTRAALGEIPQDAPPGIHLVGEHPWTERSLLRLKRYLLDQYTAALVLHEPFRRGLVVVLNNSLVQLSDGRWKFVRPARWELDRGSGALRYRLAALGAVRVRGGFVPWLTRELDGVSATYGRVCDDLGNHGEPVASAVDLDELIAIGFVHLLTPWSIDEAWVERRMLEHLRTLPPEGRLTPVIDRLRELVEFEEGYASTVNPDRSLERIADLVEELWRSLKALAGIDAGVPLNHSSDHDFYEDVLLENSDARGQGSGPAVAVSHAGVQACLRSIDPVLHLSALFRRDEDFLCTMAAYASRQWAGRERFGVLELFDAAQPIWQEYTEFCLASGQTAGGWRATFNPLGLAGLRDLQELRDDVWAGVPACVVEHDDHLEVSIHGVKSLLTDIPSRYAPKAGACLFAQPADADGTSWVVNRVKEGTGRFASRFTSVMGTAARRKYLEALVASADRSYAGVAGELLDVVSIEGDTVNVHAPHTHRVLEMPGEAVDLPDSRRLSLSDMHVRIDRDALTARMFDNTGRRVIPAHLGGGHASYLPPLVRFLGVFGPGELSPIFPPLRSEQVGDCVSRKRMMIGNVVLLRRAWSFPAGTLRTLIAGLSEARALLAISRWRTKVGVPEQAFVIQRTRSGTGDARYRKPQYVDFTSPLFLRVFTSILQRAPDDRLTLEEMLPTTAMMPRHSGGTGWAVEILIDSIGVP